MKMHRVAMISGLMAVVAMTSLPATAADQGVNVQDFHAISLATIHDETSKGLACEPGVSMLKYSESIDMTVTAKVRCTYKNLSKHQLNDGTVVDAAGVRFAAVHATRSDHQDCKQMCEENKLFGEYTPSLELSTYIINPGAQEQFEVGQEYYLHFEKAPSVEHGATKSPPSPAAAGT